MNGINSFGMMTNPENRFKRILSNPILQTFVIFISSGWIVLEITEYLIENFGLNESARKVLLIILVCILPVALTFAWISNRKRSEREGESQANSRPWKKRRILVPASLLLLAAVITLGFGLNRRQKTNKAITIDLPELQNLVASTSDYEGKTNWEIFQRVDNLKRFLASHTDYAKLWSNVAGPISINTEPEGARIYAKAYSDPNGSWKDLGKSPITDQPFPRGVSRIKIELEGYKTQYDILYQVFGRPENINPRNYKLFRQEQVPEGMVYVGAFRGNWQNTGTLAEKYVGAFWVDQFEVTNKEYKEFIESGGYEDQDFWQFPFLLDGDTLDWEDAMSRFKDQTHRFGPTDWQLGKYTEGEDSIPVSGISWYEAAAYAAFRKKALPTVYHWTYLSHLQAAPEIVKLGNFDGQRPAKIGSYSSMSRFGTYDLAGNVSEWVHNSRGANKTIMGGNWEEPSYFYSERYAITPWTRSRRLGFRCIRYENDTLRNELEENDGNPDRDFSKVQPVTEEVFEMIRSNYQYRKQPMHPRILSRKDSTDWTIEKVVIDVPYEDTPMQIHLYLPKNSKPPYQAIIYYPHIGSLYSNSMEDMRIDWWFDFIFQSGRALIWPVYYNTHGRGKIVPNDYQTWRLASINMIKDFQITCDYLETREDFDTEKLAYLGSSWGGFMSPYVLAIEKRIKTGIVSAFGVLSNGDYPEMDQISYLPRVTIPMLMLNGKFDFDFTLKTQQAYYDFLGTPEEHKRWIAYDHVHGAPYAELVNESLAWLDKYLGPVDLTDPLN